MNDPRWFSGWLPSVTIDQSIAWFPLKTSSLTALLDGIVRGPTAVDAIADAMSRDPSWLVATAMHLAAANRLPSHDPSIDDLARFWGESGKSIWRRTDWLACPTDDVLIDRTPRYKQLDHFFATLPITRWLESASLWSNETFDRPISFDLSSCGSLVDSRRVGSNRSYSLRAHETVGRLIESESSGTWIVQSYTDRIQSVRRELAHSLAYGLSHEINNPLANIATRAQALERVVDHTDQKRSLRRIVDQSYRAHAMIADLMFYANPPAPSVETFDLQECIELVLETVAEESSAMSIEVSLIAPPTFDRRVVGDSEMIGEAVMCLVRNAIDAVACDGVVQIHLKRTDPTPESSANSTWEVSICDSGPGCSAEQAVKAFDPFYSGREAGRGLGLGLCRAERIMQLHQGTATIQPALAGCVATLTWPAEFSKSTTSPEPAYSVVDFVKDPIREDL